MRKLWIPVSILWFDQVHRLEGGPICHKKTEANHIIKIFQYFTICDKKTWLPNYRINLLLFLNKSGNLISISEIKLPYKNVSLIQYKDFVPIIPILLMKEAKLFSLVTLRKHVTKYKYMRKWMVKFLSKSQSSGIKFAQVN